MKFVVYISVTNGTTKSLHDAHSFNDLLKPFQELTRKLEDIGVEVRASKDIPKNDKAEEVGIYFSFRSHREYKKYRKRPDIIFGSFYIMEPVVVRPDRYKQLPLITKYFKRVYLPNTEGFGYSLDNVDTSKLHRIYFPQAYNSILEEYWERPKEGLCVINANKLPKSFKGELYGERIRAILELSKYRQIDLYGKEWRSWKKRGTYRPIFLLNRKQVLECYKGEIDSKFEELSGYRFNLCFENMIMPGYITEKIFDCFFVGVIPIYLGAPDIAEYVDEDCFIDARKFSDYKEMAEFLENMGEAEIEKYRSNIRKYMNGNTFKKLFSPGSFSENVFSEVKEYIQEYQNGNM